MTEIEIQKSMTQRASGYVPDWQSRPCYEPATVLHHFSFVPRD